MAALPHELRLCFTTWATDRSLMLWRRFLVSIMNLGLYQVVLSEETEIGRLLHSHSPGLPAKVAAIIEGKFQPAALGQLVSSQLDVGLL